MNDAFEPVIEPMVRFFRVNSGLPDNSKVTHFFYEEAGLLFLK
jgi:hypothetical protein